MNTIFTRTLLWFIATVVLTFLALTIAAAIEFDPSVRRRGPVSSMMSLQIAEAVDAWERGGRDGLARTLARFREVTDTEGVLTDANGRDLLTGELRTDLLQQIRRQRRGAFWRGSRSVFGRRTEDGKYLYFIVLNRRNWIRWFLQPEINLPVLATLALLSYAFARHLTNPVRKLQSVVEGFGRGDLRIRARTKRKDEIGSLARSFDQMADRIETLLHAERRLLLDISHELRSPLARLSVALELARTAEDPAPHLDRIEKEVGRLNALVGELLQVTRVEGDAARMREESINLRELLEEITADAEVEASDRGFRIQLQADQDVTINGDVELLRRAIDNVLRNAARYAPEGSVVDVRMNRNGRNVNVIIRDRGPGVPAEHLPRIFEPFYRVDAHRDRHSGGTGLGLAIARRAVELHHGQITARNADPGLEIDIQLPA